MTPTLRIRLLGDFLLMSGDAPVTTINSPRLQSLLAYLVLHRNAPQDRSHLAFLLWPDSTEERAYASLRKLLYQLRQALPDIDHFLRIDKQSLYWHPTPEATWTLDIQHIEQAFLQAEQAEQSQDMTAIRHALEQVMRLYRGALLPSCYDEWIVSERDYWQQLFLKAAERLLALLEEERDYDTAIRVAQQLLRQDVLHEATYRQLMRLHALRGDRAAALRVYHTCATVLERELATEPGAATQATYEALMQSHTDSATSTSPLPSRSAAPPLLGRKGEWRQLQDAWRKVANGRFHTVLLTGEAGIGKTRLAEEMELWVSRQGMTTASAHCYATLEGLAYVPVTAWLRSDALQTSLLTLDALWLTEIARLLPELFITHPKLPRPAPMSEGWQRQHFFEALARVVLNARQPLLLLLDDLQWCDNETLQWLYYLGRFSPQIRFLLIGTMRAGETLSDPLLAWLATLQRDGLVTEIPLVPLTANETTSLAEHILGHQLDANVSKTLYSETEGNPLFVVEMARTTTLEHREKLSSTPKMLITSSASMLPPAVQTVLAARLAQLSPLAHEVANVAAVIGRAFTFSVLLQACGQSEDNVVRGLDELWQRRIVREQGAGTADSYDFSHDKLREQVYLSMSSAHRRLLHRHIAEAIEVVHGRDLDTVSGQIATHYEHAGRAEKAMLYYKQAGEAASRIYANLEAIRSFERAIALLEARPSEHGKQDLAWEAVAQVYEDFGDVLQATGRYEKARQSYQHAMTIVPSAAYLWQARLRRKIASVWNQVSPNPHDICHSNARQALQEAEQILTSVVGPLDEAWSNEWIELQFAQIWPMRGSVDDMMAAIERAKPAVEQYGTPEQRKLLSLAKAMCDSVRNRYVVSEHTIFVLRTALTELQQKGDQHQLAVIHFALGTTLLWAGQLDEAEKLLKKALQMAENMRIAWLQARCLTFLPFVFRQRGQVEQVRNMLTQAEAIGIVQNNNILIAHHAWVAWRDGNLLEAEMAAKRSMEQGQRQQVDNNPFQWAALWLLLAVMLVQEKMSEAINNVRLLLDPTLQPPSEQLRTRLEAALQAWDAGQQQEAQMLLQQTVPLAENMGYL